MRIFLSIVFSLLLYGVGAFAESRQAPPIDQSTSKGDNAAYSKTPPDKNIEQPPFKVTITPPPKNDPGRNEYEAERSSNTFVAFGTIAIAFITAVILFFQLIVFNRQARRLSDTVEAMMTSERPYLFVDVKGHYDMIKNLDKTTCICECSILNRGKTPAIITYADIKIMWEGETDLSLSEKGRPNAKVVLGTEESITLSKSRNLRVDLWNNKLFCYGLIRYTDIFRKEWETKFHWVYIAPIEGFCVSDNTERNHYT